MQVPASPVGSYSEVSILPKDVDSCSWDLNRQPWDYKFVTHTAN